MSRNYKLLPFLVTLGIIVCAGPSHADTFSLTGTIRDFSDTHPDFEAAIAAETGLVESTLGAGRKPVYAGGAGTLTTHGAVPFDQWYRDVAGVNTSKPLTITLDNTITADPEVFTFTDGAFFPIDDELMGNQGRSHNYHFTYELHGSFDYTGGEMFTFTGDDDLWVFMNDELVIDLGGVHSALSASVSLDTLGLTVGETYPFDLFFAERHTTASSFRIDTSLGIVPEPSTASLSLLGIMGVMATARRRRKHPRIAVHSSK